MRALVRRTLTPGRVLPLFAPALSGLVGFLEIAHSQVVLLGAAGLTAASVTAAVPWFFPVLAVPAIWVPGLRIAGLLSVGDAVLTVAAVLVLLDSRRPRLPPAGRHILVLLGALLATDSVAVLAHPSRQGAQEVVHRLILVGGGLAVGAWLVYRARLTLALRLLVMVSLPIAVVAVIDRLTSGAAAYPLGYHKNFAGPAFATASILLLVVPETLATVGRPLLRWVPFGILLAGLLATSSRGAIIGFVLAVTVWLLKPRTSHRRVNPVVAVLLVAGLGYLAVSSVQQQLSDQASGRVKFDSITQRRLVEGETRDLWRTSPLTGVGLRFFATPKFDIYQPPNNMFDEALAEAGIIGALGLAVFVVGGVVVTFRLKTPPGEAANMLVLAAFFHGQVDIFWLNGQALNWLIVGAGVALEALAVGPSNVTARGLPEPLRS